MEKIETDVCIIGGGVIGLAVAWRLAESGRQVVVLERHPAPGMGTSSRNSEVIHAGIYYPPDSLKSRLCIEGRREAYEFFERYGVPHRKCGKFLLAIGETEVDDLEALVRKARSLGVEGLRPVTREELARLEPRVRCTSAWFSAESGIVSSHLFCERLAGLASERDATIVCRAEAFAVDRTASRYRVAVKQRSSASVEERYEIEAPIVVNAAGLHADRVAALAGFDIRALGYEQTWVRGDYFTLSGRWRGAFSHLLYPLPERNVRGLGIHVTIDLEGSARLGPNVVEIPREEQYEVDALSRDAFFSAASRYLDGLSPDDLSPGYSGIRPKLSKPGEAARDFVIREERDRGCPGFVNLLGIESPGLTSALAIARTVEGLLSDRA